MISAREAAFRSLLRCENDGRYSNLEIDSAIKKNGLDGAEKNLFVRLVYGTIERKITLDYIISVFSARESAKIEPDAAVILRIAFYQLFYMDRIPVHAAVNEAVECAQRHCRRGVDGYVNAVLRAALRAWENGIEYPDNKTEALCLEYSVPRSLVDMWLSQYGEKNTEKILRGISKIPPVTLHANTLKTTADELCSLLCKSGHNAARSKNAPDAIILRGSMDDEIHRLINEGLCFVQDSSSQLCAAALEASSDMTVVDTCACPGGKSFAIAMAMNNIGTLYSFDLHKNKLSLIENGADKLGISIIKTDARDATQPDEALLGQADRVLCDVPCSGFGVIAKKPDIRHRRTEDIIRLPEIQYDILSASSRYLKPGGRLVYSTCTLNRKENEEVVHRFADGNSDFEICSEQTVFPSETNDGFFTAILQKNR